MKFVLSVNGQNKLFPSERDAYVYLRECSSKVWRDAEVISVDDSEFLKMLSQMPFPEIQQQNNSWF